MGLTIVAWARVGVAGAPLDSEVGGVGAEVVESYEMLSIVGRRVRSLFEGGREVGRLVRGRSLLEQLDQLLELASSRRIFDRMSEAGGSGSSREAAAAVEWQRFSGPGQDVRHGRW